MQRFGVLGAEAFRQNLVSAGCNLIDLHDAGDAGRHWNGALHPNPALIVRCQTGDQVSRALRLAREVHQPVSIHNGGHDWLGRSLRDDSVVLDLSAMTTIGIDVERREATIGGGVTAGQLNAAAGEKGLAAVIGNDGAIGMVGLLTGGGYGPLMTRFGLACDSLLSAEVIMTDGSIVCCDADNEPDLFWALRGGGGNFGVVTTARLRLYDLAPPIVINVVFPWSDARPALVAYAELMHCAPAELFGSVVLAVGPAGAPVAGVSLVWTGADDRGGVLVSEVTSAGAPIAVKVGRMPASALLSLTDDKLVQGRGYDVGTRWFATLSRDAISTLIVGFEARTSSLSSIIVHHCHGAATAISADVSAFGQREPHFTALLYATWDPPSIDGAGPRAWTAQLMADLAPTALTGGYANLLPDSASEQIATAYGPNAAKLADLKRRYDPDGVLRAIPLPSR